MCFLAKNQLPSKCPETLIISILAKSLPRHDNNRLLCLIRAFKYYLNKTTVMILSFRMARCRQTAGIFLPIYPGPIKGPVPNAKKYVFSQFRWKNSQSEKEISEIKQCIYINIVKASKAHTLWILPALTISKYVKYVEINCYKRN